MIAQDPIAEDPTEQDPTEHRATAQDTIVAVSSAAGVGLRGIVRLSGPRAFEIAQSCFREEHGSAAPESAAPESATRGLARVARGVLAVQTRGGRTLELPAEAVLFRAPRSYTREDVVELHTLGSGPWIGRVCAALLDRGARLAEPGEFTRRAFLSGRIDLTQVEAVLELIRASSQAEADRAVQRYGGDLGRAVRAVRDRLVALAARIEAQLDFSDQDIEVLGVEELLADVEAAIADLERIRCTDAGGELARESASATLVGAPNAGKSSLFNAAVGRDRSMVSGIAGTTLDAVEAHLVVAGRDVRLIDAPGLGRGSDALEAEAMRRLPAWVAQADVVVLVVDRSADPPPELADIRSLVGGRPVVIAASKCDHPERIDPETLARLAAGAPIVETSAVTGAGVPALLETVVRLATAAEAGREAGTYAANARQAALVAGAAAALARIDAESAGELELSALEVRDAITRLGRVTGEDFTESLLDRVFADFCIGK